MEVSVNGYLCFKLETGGISIGLFHMFLATLAIGFSLFHIFKYGITLIAASCVQYCINTCGIMIGFYVTVTVAGLGCAYIGYRTIKGIEARDHTQLKPMMGLLCFLICLLTLSMLIYPGYCLIYGPLSVVFYVYMFAVINSVYNMFKGERESKSNDYYQVHNNDLIIEAKFCQI